MKKFHFLSALCFLSVSGSCVSSKKFNDAIQDNRILRENLEKQETESTNKIKELSDQIAALKGQINGLQSERDALQMQYDDAKKEIDGLKELVAALEQQLKNVESGSALEKNKLMNALDNYKAELNKKEEKLKQLSNNLLQQENKLRQMTLDLQQREQRLLELENLLKEKERAIAQMHENLKKILLEFEDKGLSIEQKNGRIYVRLAAALLFQSGKTDVDEKGRAAVIGLARALEKEDDIQILVEGHTDNTPVKSGSFPRDNWELSVLRATAVVQIMLDNSKIARHIITAAGRGEYMPISENKALNRRIEVIIIPNLDKIMKAIAL